MNPEIDPAEPDEKDQRESAANKRPLRMASSGRVVKQQGDTEVHGRGHHAVTAWKAHIEIRAYGAPYAIGEELLWPCSRDKMLRGVGDDLGGDHDKEDPRSGLLLSPRREVEGRRHSDEHKHRKAAERGQLHHPACQPR